MEWYYIVALVVAFVSAVYIFLCLLLAPKFLREIVTPKSRRTYEDAKRFQEEQENWDFTNFESVWDKHYFEVTTFDGFKLNCLYILNPKKSNKVAIVSHGHISNMYQSVKYADLFLNKGYNVVMYDQRYFGKSEGDFCTLGQNETQDLVAVIDKTKEIFGDNCFLALHGESMGGATVLSVLKERGDDIKFVVADCPFSDTFTMLREMSRIRAHIPSFPIVDFANILAKCKHNYDFRAVSPKKVVKHSNVPICFIHGDKDRLILPRHSKILYKLAQNPLSELHLFEGAFHARSHMKDAKKYKKIVGDFVDKIEKRV